MIFYPRIIRQVCARVQPTKYNANCRLYATATERDGGPPGVQVNLRSLCRFSHYHFALIYRQHNNRARGPNTIDRH